MSLSAGSTSAIASQLVRKTSTIPPAAAASRAAGSPAGGRAGRGRRPPSPPAGWDAPSDAGERYRGGFSAGPPPPTVADVTTGPTAGARVVGGRYEIADELGRGGMGVVWLANDRVLHREVALKEISYPLHLTDEERAVLRERTLREARAAARLEDPHVVAIHDVVEEDGRPWLVMEHVRSRSLQKILEEDGPLSPTAVARIGLDVLSAIEVAHAAGVLHRDVKPGNVLVDDDGHACL